MFIPRRRVGILQRERERERVQRPALATGRTNEGKSTSFVASAGRCRPGPTERARERASERGNVLVGFKVGDV